MNLRNRNKDEAVRLRESFTLSEKQIGNLKKMGPPPPPPPPMAFRKKTP